MTKNGRLEMRRIALLTTAIAIGKVIRHVAVFEIHIDRNAVEIMNPRTSRDKRVPTR